MVWDFAFSPLTLAPKFELLSHITKIEEKYFNFSDPARGAAPLWK
jgi:hypothetical protein